MKPSAFIGLSRQSIAYLTLMLTSLNFAAAADEHKKPSGPPVQMEPFVVSEKTRISFGFGINITKNTATQKVVEIYVKSVKEGSEAALKGMTPLTRIYNIDGHPVEELDASFQPGSDLFKAFINRKEGETIVLAIAPPGTITPQTITLTEKRGLPKWPDMWE